MYLLLPAHLLLNDIFLISFVCLALRRLTWALSRVLSAKWPVSGYEPFPPLGRTNGLHFVHTLAFKDLHQFYLLPPYPELLPVRSFAIVLPAFLLLQANLLAQFQLTMAFVLARLPTKLKCALSTLPSKHPHI